MWRSKKFIMVAVLTTVMLAAGIGGVALAQTGTGDDSQPKTLLERVTAILVGKGVNVTPEQLEEAFTQARTEMRTEALDSRLQALVKEGRITQQQADDYKVWLEKRPDIEPFRQQLRQWEQARPGIPPEVKEWQEARPEMPSPGPFGGPGFGGHGFRGGMKWGGGGYFWGR